MITNVKLEIDWADQLWVKFPLVARALGELKGLLKLQIIIIEKDKTTERKRRALIEQDANFKETMITLGQTPKGKGRKAATNRAQNRVKREGPVADVMLKAEMKMLKGLVKGIKGLKDFRLIGFRHEVFAWCLEEQVRLRNH